MMTKSTSSIVIKTEVEKKLQPYHASTPTNLNKFIKPHEIQLAIILIIQRVLAINKVQRRAGLKKAINALYAISESALNHSPEENQLEKFKKLYTAWEATWFLLDSPETYTMADYQNTINTFKSDSMPSAQKIAIIMIGIAAAVLGLSIAGVASIGVGVGAAVVGVLAFGLFKSSQRDQIDSRMESIQNAYQNTL